MVKQLITEAVNALLPIVVTVLSLGVAWLGKTLNAWIGAKVKNERLQLVLRRLSEVVCTVVLELQQTEVSALKTAIGDASQGGRKITKDEGQALLDAALVKVRTYLGIDGLKLLTYVLGLTSEKDLNEFLVSRIEATVHTAKNQGSMVFAEPVKLQTTT
ncbi:MAG: hypothetical protein WC565_04905 [Parcubacteria group bacterium]